MLTKEKIESDILDTEWKQGLINIVKALELNERLIWQEVKNAILAALWKRSPDDLTSLWKLYHWSPVGQQTDIIIGLQNII